MMFIFKKGFIYLIIISAFLNTCKDPPTDAPEIVTKITGKITDAKTNIPISGTSVTTNPVTSSITTSDDGNYTIPDVTPGQYTITAIKEEYNSNSKTVSVTEGKTVNADIQLMPIGGELSVSIETLDFGVSQTNLTFEITNKTKIGTITWQITFDQSWMEISPISGTTTTETDIISVSVNRDSLNFGNHSGLITINSDYGSKEVNISMVKQNPNVPQLTIFPVNIDFGSSDNAQLLSISNTGTGKLDWNATPNSNWIIMSVDSGSVFSNNSSEIQITLDKSNLQPNDYKGSISFTSNGGYASALVKMKIESGTLNPPTLQIIGTPTQNSISLEWTKIVDQNFSNYKLYRSLSPAVNENSTLVTTQTDPGINNFTDTGLSSGTNYYYRVFAYNISDVGSGSNEVSASTTTGILTPPALQVVGTPTLNSISLEWTKVSVDNFSSYKLYRSTTTGVTESSDLVTTINDVATTNFTNSGLNSGTTYFYKIFAYNKESIGSGSNEVSASTIKDLGSWVVTTSIPGVVAGYSNYNYQNSNCLFAVSDENVWFIYEQVVLHYDGQSWTKNFTLPTSEVILSVFFLNQNSGWIVGSSGTFYVYNGSSWSKISDDLIGTNTLVDVVASSANDIWIASSRPLNSFGGEDNIFHFDGSAWSKYSISSIIDLEILSNNNIWALSKDGNVYKFNGTGWMNLEDLPNNSSFGNISAFSANDVWISCTDYGSGSSGLWHYNGNEFSGSYKLSGGNTYHIGRYAVDMVSSTEGWSSKTKENSVYRISHFDGNTWSDVNSPINNPIYSIKMPSENSGWAVGTGGEILRYTK